MRIEGKLDNVGERITAFGDRIVRLEERSGVTSTGLETHRQDVSGDLRASREELRGAQARLSALELAKAQAEGSGRVMGLVWGAVVALPGLAAFWRSM